MNVEFVYPADSAEVIASANLNSVPNMTDQVNISGTTYRVYSIEWCVFEDKPYDDRVGVLVNLILDEIEEYNKKVKAKK